MDVFSGDTIDIYYTLVDANNFPLDLTNLTLWWGMADIIKKSPDEITYTNNVAVVHVLPADTIGMSGPHKHQLRAVDPTGRIETLSYEVCRITASVFQPDAIVQPTKILRLVGGIYA